jgi:hypothetical protein
VSISPFVSPGMLFSLSLWKSLLSVSPLWWKSRVRGSIGKFEVAFGQYAADCCGLISIEF